MAAFHRVTVLLAALVAVPAFAAQGGSRARAGGGVVRPPTQVRPQSQPRQPRAAQSHPGDEIIRRLSSLTPEQLDQALSRLPPAQRANIARRIENFQKQSPVQQRRTLERLEKLNNLPPQEQQEVRKSVREFNALPQDRKMAINRDLRQMAKMPESDRGNYINSDDFQSRYSPDEQRMIGNLIKIQPSAP